VFPGAFQEAQEFQAIPVRFDPGVLEELVFDDIRHG
jgi:hypothetical protein